LARGRGPTLIVTSLLLAGGAAWMANRWITARALPVAPVATTHILTSAMNLQLGTKIESRHVSTMEMIPGQEPAGAFHDFKEIEGKVTTANVLGRPDVDGLNVRQRRRKRPGRGGGAG